MRRLVTMLAVLLFSAALQAAEPPRLILVISVDQMRADYLDRFAFTDGFARLKKEGAVFDNARHAHIPTETGPGHATILSGSFPAQHGIVGNRWWDRARVGEVSSVDDSVYGLGPESLLSYTIGDALKARNAESRVVAVSLKDRAAIPMAGKRADLAAWYDEKAGQATSSTYYGEIPGWLSAMRAPKDIKLSPAGDEFVLQLALKALDKYDLGDDKVTDLLAVSFSCPDYLGHKLGIEHPEFLAEYAALDLTLGRLIEEAEGRSGKGRLLVVLTADHGVVPAPEDQQGKALGVRRVSEEGFHKKLEERLQRLHKAPGQSWVLYANLPNVYLNRELARQRGLDWHRLLGQATAAAAGLDGVAQVYNADTYAKSDIVRRSYHPGRSGDLIVLPKPAVLFTDNPSGTGHGTPYDYDARVPVIFLGESVRPGRYPAPAWVADIAPTLAQLLGLPWTAQPGSRVLAEALR
jgi:predicted AlkP superfamily pyrophosphatase or phosphodiesterase